MAIFESVNRKIKRILTRLFNSRVKNFDNIKGYFKDKAGLEIGGPSSAFTFFGYVPIYRMAGMLDGVNFSRNTIWTGEIKNEQDFIVNGKIVGKLYIADTTNLSSVENMYDFILSSNNIEHVANPMKAVEQWVQKLKANGVIVIIAPRKECNFDHKRNVVTFDHLLGDYVNNKDEHDLTHLEEILNLHDLSLDAPAGTFEQFKERSLKNYENRCLHHHVFDLNILEKMCKYFGLQPVLMEQKEHDYIIIVKKQ